MINANYHYPVKTELFFKTLARLLLLLLLVSSHEIAIKLPMHLVSDSTKLISFFRDKRAQYIYRATSPNDGATWSKPTKTTLPNNDSGIQATVFMSGHIAIMYNPTNGIRYEIPVKITH